MLRTIFNVSMELFVTLASRMHMPSTQERTRITEWRNLNVEKLQEPLHFLPIASCLKGLRERLALMES